MLKYWIGPASSAECCSRETMTYSLRRQDDNERESRFTVSCTLTKLEEIETQREAKGLENPFRTATRKQVGGIMTTVATSFFAERKQIVELAGKYQLPAIYPQREFVEEGGLMSYGVDLADLYRRAAVYVEKNHVAIGTLPASFYRHATDRITS